MRRMVFNLTLLICSEITVDGAKLKLCRQDDVQDLEGADLSATCSVFTASNMNLFGTVTSWLPQGDATIPGSRGLRLQFPKKHLGRLIPIKLQKGAALAKKAYTFLTPVDEQN